MIPNPSFEMRKDIVRVWGRLRTEIDWRKISREVSDPKEEKKLNRLNQRIVHDFLSKHESLAQVRSYPQFGSVRITASRSVCLVLPHDFLTFFRDRSAEKVNLDILLTQEMTIEEAVFIVKDILLAVRKPLRPTDIKILRALSRLSFAGGRRMIPPPISSDLARLAGLPESTARIYYKSYLTKNQLIFHYLLFNPWSFGYELVLSPEMTELGGGYSLWRQAFQNKYFCLTQFPQVSDDTLPDHSVQLVNKIVYNYNLTGLRKKDEESFTEALIPNPITDDPLVKFRRPIVLDEMSEEEYKAIVEFSKKGLYVTESSESPAQVVSTVVGKSEKFVYDTIHKALERSWVGYLPRIKHIGCHNRFAVRVQGSTKVLEEVSNFLMQVPFSIHYLGDDTGMFYVMLHKNQLLSFFPQLDRISRHDSGAELRYASFTTPESVMEVTTRLDHFQTEKRLGHLVHTKLGD